MAFGLLSLSFLEPLVLMLVREVINKKPSSRAQSLTTKTQVEGGSNGIWSALSLSLLELLEGVINRKPSSRAQSLTTKMQAERGFNDI
jgi:hypothetical protein